jgi:hypothetical protein
VTTPGDLPNKDLEDLGIVLLSCMLGAETEYSPDEVRDLRRQNKVYGLTEPERWIGSKELLDFLDLLFDEDRTPLSKLAKAVSSLVPRNRLPLTLAPCAARICG